MNLGQWLQVREGCIAVINDDVNDTIPVVFQVKSTGLYADVTLCKDMIGQILINEPVFVIEVGDVTGMRPWMRVITSHGIGYTRFLVFTCVSCEA